MKVTDTILLCLVFLYLILSVGQEGDHILCWHSLFAFKNYLTLDMCKLGKSGKLLGSQSSDILIFTLG